jgi:hypothetical protein
MMTSAVMWCLTMSKNREADRSGWSQIPLMRLVVRDDVALLVAVICE